MAGPKEAGAHGLAWRGSGFEGNWYVEWRGTRTDGKEFRTRYAFMTITHGWNHDCMRTKDGACLWVERVPATFKWKLYGEYGFDRQYGTTYYPNDDTKVTNSEGDLAIHGPYGVWGYWDGNSTLHVVGPNALSETWTYKDESRGTGIWRRAIPEISHVIVKTNGPGADPKFKSDTPNGTPARVEFSYDTFWWGPVNNARGNRPSFVLKVYGHNLWGSHVVEFLNEPDLETGAYVPIVDDTGKNDPNHVVGIAIDVHIWPKSRPGRKALYIDGIPVPFDLVVKGYPGTKTFRIGKLEIARKGLYARMTDASNRIVSAQNALHADQKLLAERQAELQKQRATFAQVYRTQQDRLRPLEAAYRAYVAQMVVKERARARAAAPRARPGEIAAMKKRIAVIGERLKLSDDVYGGAENAKVLKGRLRAERAQLQAKLARLGTSEKLKSPAELRAGSRRARDLYDAWQATKHQSDQIVSNAGRDLEFPFNEVHHLEDRLVHDERELDAASAEWRKLQAGLANGLVQVSSDDYRVRIGNRAPEIAELNAAVDKLRRNLRDAQDVHEKARAAMLRQVQATEDAGQNLIDHGVESVAGQYLVDAAFEIGDVAWTSLKEGPHVAFGQAMMTAAMNTIHPPTYYDAQVTDIPSGRSGVLEILVKDANSARKTAPWNLGAKIAAPMAVKAIPGAARVTTAKFSLPFSLNNETQALAAVQGELNELGLEEGTHILQTGLIATLSKKVLTGMGTSFAKGVARDLIKKAIAQYVEGPAMTAYLEAQLRLTSAVNAFRISGAIVHESQDALDQIVPMRDKAVAQYRPQSEMTVEKNDPFEVKAGYAFTLYMRDGERLTEGGGSGTLPKARVFLQNVELAEKSVPGGRQYVVKPEDAARFDSTMPDELTLRVEQQ